ncbi:LYSMD3 family protein [Megaselia abdita]
MAKTQQPKFEPTIEAQIQNGDTLQALALRFHCTIADIKRLNKIDKENEIFARKVIKVPITAHSIILETLPSVHRSGQSSPKQVVNGGASGSTDTNGVLKTDTLQEKLLVASVVSSGSKAETSINDIILNSKIKSDVYRDGFNDEEAFSENNNLTDPLLTIDNTAPRIRQIRAPTHTVFDWSGSDCDISWIVLLVCILILCIIIPSLIIGNSLIHHNVTTDHPGKI